MARRPPPSDETPPDLSLEKGLLALKRLKEQGESILLERPISEGRFRTWLATTASYIGRIFGARHNHVWNFARAGPSRAISSDYEESEEYQEPQRAETMRLSLDVLESIIDTIQLEVGFDLPSSVHTGMADDALMAMFHPKVTAVAKSLFESKHYAESAAAAFKELDNEVQRCAALPPDSAQSGTPLMFSAFKAEDGKIPIIRLADTSTKTGRDTQEGYKFLYVGSMLGIRNPKAHSNLGIKRSRAIQFLFLATLLFEKLDERLR